jgi:uncharacterized protein (DUF2141 family)
MEVSERNFVFQSYLLTTICTLFYKVLSINRRRPTMTLSKSSLRAFGVAGAALAATGSAAAAPLTVNVNGIEARGGTLYVGVQTEAQFMKNDGIAGEMVTAPDAGNKTFTFDLPEGRYSISIWHDFNGNNQFDMSEAGPPADGWAMINGEAMRATPTFDNASLTLPATGASATVKVLYPQ